MQQPICFNPNRDKSEVDEFAAATYEEKQKQYLDFFHKIKITSFRQLHNVEIVFNSPVAVITGSNRTGKSSIMQAIGCSHFMFMTRNPLTGEYERSQWGKMMRFTHHDIQTEDWEYRVSYWEHGGNTITKAGKRKRDTKKWNGVAKKEGQIGTPGPGIDVNPRARKVFYIDLERIMPGRHFPTTVYNRVRRSPKSVPNRMVDAYLSYVLENSYSVGAVGNIGERSVYAFDCNNRYSSFNTASGEDVLIHLLRDIVAAPKNSLILIEEIEVGLHPEIQRRLMDLIYREARHNKKQFIITTHSPSIISAVAPHSRILLSRKPDGVINCRQNVSLCHALSSMDNESYPLLSVYVEDDISHSLLLETLRDLQASEHRINKLVRIIEVGSADKTYNYFKNRQTTDCQDKLNRGYACVLDGDQKALKDRVGNPRYPDEPLLFFHDSNEAPERMLLRNYLANHPNARLQYHVDDGNAHNLMQKMVDEGLAINESDALAKCIAEYKASVAGSDYFGRLKQFIIDACDNFLR